MDAPPRYGGELAIEIGGLSLGPYDVTPGAAAFWEGAARHEVLIRRCRDCGLHSHPRQEACEHCFGGDLAWAVVSGEGEIYTFSTIHRSPAPETQTPYTLGFVRLDEDVYLFAEILAPDVRIGDRVSPVFVESPLGTLIKFAATGSSD